MRPHQIKHPLSSVLIAAVLLVAAAPVGADSLPRDAQIKAAFIYNFVQFTEWPADGHADRSSDFVLGILHAGVNDLLPVAIEKAVSNKQVGGHRIVVRHFATVNDVQPCHAIVISGTAKVPLAAVREHLGGGPALTIGESDGFAAEDGMIRLYQEENRIRFEVNLAATGKARLKISAKLLKLAKVR